MNKLPCRCDPIGYFKNTGKPAVVADIADLTTNLFLLPDLKINNYKVSNMEKTGCKNKPNSSRFVQKTFTGPCVQEWMFRLWIHDQIGNGFIKYHILMFVYRDEIWFWICCVFSAALAMPWYVVPVNIRISLWVNRVQIYGYEIWNNLWCREIHDRWRIYICRIIISVE